MSAIISTILGLIPWDIILPVVGQAILDFLLSKTKKVESNSMLELGLRSGQKALRRNVKL